MQQHKITQNFDNTSGLVCDPSNIDESISVKQRRSMTLYPHQKNISALSHGAVMPTTKF